MKRLAAKDASSEIPPLGKSVLTFKPTGATAKPVPNGITLGHATTRDVNATTPTRR